MSMDTEGESSKDRSRCANCAVAEGDNNDVKLKSCAACHLVKYCNAKCQKEHRASHKNECKRRSAELRDELLFKQPESSHLGDCPICYLPLSLDETKHCIMPCCSQLPCLGCFYTKQCVDLKKRQVNTCPFCRQAVSTSRPEMIMRIKARADKNDPVAMHEEGMRLINEQGDFQSGVPYLFRAAKMGVAQSHFELAAMHKKGEGGVKKDFKRCVYHWEQAAIGGYPEARFYLGCTEWNTGKYQRAAKHLMIAAKAGHDKALGELKKVYQNGIISKDDYATALREHQAAVDETKSSPREAVDIFLSHMHSVPGTAFSLVSSTAAVTFSKRIVSDY